MGTEGQENDWRVSGNGLEKGIEDSEIDSIDWVNARCLIFRRGTVGFLTLSMASGEWMGLLASYVHHQCYGRGLSESHDSSNTDAYCLRMHILAPPIAGAFESDWYAGNGISGRRDDRNCAEAP